MALIVEFRNISALARKSDYTVAVWINRTMIAGPFLLKDHVRSKGWEALVAQFTKEVAVTRRRIRAKGKDCG